MEQLNNELLLSCVGGSKLGGILNKVAVVLRKIASSLVLIAKGSVC